MLLDGNLDALIWGIYLKVIKERYEN